MHLLSKSTSPIITMGGAQFIKNLLTTIKHQKSLRFVDSNDNPHDVLILQDSVSFFVSN